MLSIAVSSHNTNKNEKNENCDFYLKPNRFLKTGTVTLLHDGMV